MTESTPPGAFISYRRLDAKDFAMRLYNDLKSAGIEAWLDLSAWTDFLRW